MSYLLAPLVLIAAFLVWRHSVQPPLKAVAPRPAIDDPLASLAALNQPAVIPTSIGTQPPWKGAL